MSDKRLQIIKGMTKKQILEMLEEQLSLEQLNKLILFNDKRKLIENLNSIYSSTEIVDIIYTTDIPNEILLNKFMEKLKDENSECIILIKYEILIQYGKG
jgi:hypothetical protein